MPQLACRVPDMHSDTNTTTFSDVHAKMYLVPLFTSFIHSRVYCFDTCLAIGARKYKFYDCSSKTSASFAATSSPTHHLSCKNMFYVCMTINVPTWVCLYLPNKNILGKTNFAATFTQT